VESFALDFWDYAAFLGYLFAILLVGYIAGRKKKRSSGDFFLAGRALPWYVVGASFIAANIHSEHFIGMIGAAYVYGVAPAYYAWGNVASFTLLIWLFIPFLIASGVFTTPEYMERRFSPALRQFFAYTTVLINVVAFLAAVLYGGAVALEALVGLPLELGVLIMALFGGTIATYGGLRSVAFSDVITVAVMILGGTVVTLYGLHALSGEAHSIAEGFRVMIERNQATFGPWAEAVSKHSFEIVGRSDYDRLSVVQPASHQLTPWPMLIFGVFSISIWYNVCNQLMIQRVLAARNIYHARMGILLAGYVQAFLPVIIVLPGMIWFAAHPEILLGEWGTLQTEADQVYVRMLKSLVPIGVRGLFLAALYGAIQSTLTSALNSTATVVTLDIYKRQFRPDASEQKLVRVGRITSVVAMIVAATLAIGIKYLDLGLFTYVQTLYSFFAPPFAAAFTLGILFRRINAYGAVSGVLGGFLLAVAMKIYVYMAGDAAIAWIVPFGMQAIINWAFCTTLCVVVSLVTPAPPPEKISENLTFSFKNINIFSGLGNHWYSNVITWWLLFGVIIAGLFLLFSGLVY